MMNRLGNLASIFGLILAIYQLCLSTQESNWALIGMAVLFALLFVFSLVRNESTKKYLVAMRSIQDLHYDVIKDQEDYKGWDFQTCIVKLSDVCYRISNIFDILKNDNISVCIKYTNQSGSEYYVNTLCRDARSHSIRNEKYDNIENDTIIGNTDFHELFQKISNGNDWQDVYFHANYLPQKHQYMNTHLDTTILSDKWYSLISRNKDWSLPYKSTIVVPIVSDNQKNIYGYLCIDSKSNNGFNNDQDVKLLQDIAVYLSPIIRIISENHLRIREDEFVEE